MSDELNIALGKVLAEERQKAGLSQEGLAHDAGLHSTYISQLERGIKAPTTTTLWKISEVMDLKVSKLMAKVERRMEKE